MNSTQTFKRIFNRNPTPNDEKVLEDIEFILLVEKIYIEVQQYQKTNLLKELNKITPNNPLEIFNKVNPQIKESTFKKILKNKRPFKIEHFQKNNKLKAIATTTLALAIAACSAKQPEIKPKEPIVIQQPINIEQKKTIGRYQIDLPKELEDFTIKYLNTPYDSYKERNKILDGFAQKTKQGWVYWDNWERIIRISDKRPLACSDLIRLYLEEIYNLKWKGRGFKNRRIRNLLKEKSIVKIKAEELDIKYKDSQYKVQKQWYDINFEVGDIIVYRARITGGWHTGIVLKVVNNQPVLILHSSGRRGVQITEFISKTKQINSKTKVERTDGFLALENMKIYVLKPRAKWQK